MLGVECICCSLETFCQGGHVFLGDHADVLPVFLEFLHGLELVLPEDFCVGNQFFDLGADGFLVCQVLQAFVVHFFNEGSALFLNLFVVALEVVAVFLELGCRDRTDFLPAVSNITELVQKILARFFLSHGIHFGEQFVAGLFVAPVFPLLHFLETAGGGLVFLPQVMIFELLFADDFLPLVVAVTNLLVQFAEVFVFVEGLDLFDKSAELCGVFFHQLLGAFGKGGNLFR